MVSPKHKVAVLQSNYLPWKGYFDIIKSVDLFVFYDDVQYTKNDWRNRNIIQTADGPRWLSVPCGSNIKRLVSEVVLNDSKWQRSHFDIIKFHYSRSKFYKDIEPLLKDIYLCKKWKNLSELNRFIIKTICSFLSIRTRFDCSQNYELYGSGDVRLLNLLKKVRADCYLSGPSAKNYMTEDMFIDNGIEVVWADYSGYPVYEQLHQPFNHQVSVIDLLMNVGHNAPEYMKVL